MTTRSCKLGLVLPDGLHERMIGLARGGPVRPPRGAIQALYERAFIELLAALDAGEAVVFPAVRGPKARVTLRLSEALCARIRTRLAPLRLKLTDFACAAVRRTLIPSQGD
jgi:hypothetical protein